MQNRSHAHTNEPCIIASHARLLCNVARKRARLGSAGSAFTDVAVVVTGESPIVGPCGYACRVWSSAGGVSGLGDGVGEGDNDSGGVEPVECYTPT
jgi:hypothetical protein